MGIMVRRELLWALLASVLSVRGQVIEFESGGYRYQTLTRNGLTIMFAPLSSLVREYAVLQVAVSNGSSNTYTIRPEDFVVQSPEGNSLPGSPARQVVSRLIEHAGRGDVVKLVTAYEASLYGNSKYKATNGYEQRRQSALAEVSSTKLKAAAAASAIAFVQTKLAPGESTDGAIFYDNNGRFLTGSLLRVKAAGSTFEFPIGGAHDSNR
ncbi:MAG TPA: hypothetical protein VE621_23880 [Bryobacteraceae bacterium]|nr:hypothetical protein [Bryobacteraceae bacterium]